MKQATSTRSKQVESLPGKPRLLFLCQTLPFPPDGGVEIRTYNILRLLARNYRIHALCFYRKQARGGEGQLERSRRGLEALGDIEIFHIPQEHSGGRLIWDHLRSVLQGRVFTCFAYESRPFRRRLSELLSAQRFDLVHVDSLDLSGYLPVRTDAPVICTHHNVESDLLFRRAEADSSWIMRRYARLQARLMLKEERKWLSRVALNISVSAADAIRLREIDPDANVTVIPNGVDTSLLQPRAGNPEGVLFVGGHSWYPNREAMGFFRSEILPHLRKSLPDVQVTWVGRASPEAQEEYAEGYGIQLTGYVDDVRPYIGGAACYIVPLRVGGGSRLKVLDAWAMGKAIVSTSIGCEGLDARDGANILVRDDPEEFAEAVTAVLRDPGLREKLGAAGRRTAEEMYEWEVIGRRLDRELSALTSG